MPSALKHYIVAAGLALPYLLFTSSGAAAQGRNGRGGGDDGGVSVEFTAEISFSVGTETGSRPTTRPTPTPGSKHYLGVFERTWPEVSRCLLASPSGSRLTRCDPPCPSLEDTK